MAVAGHQHCKDQGPFNGNKQRGTAQQNILNWQPINALNINRLKILDSPEISGFEFIKHTAKGSIYDYYW
jgi:hypothetical protein